MSVFHPYIADDDLKHLFKHSFSTIKLPEIDWFLWNMTNKIVRNVGYFYSFGTGDRDNNTSFNWMSNISGYPSTQETLLNFLSYARHPDHVPPIASYTYYARMSKCELIK